MLVLGDGMAKVILICGKICSGKTFYARQLLEKENAVIFSTDEVTYDLTDNAQGEGYDAFAKRVNAYLMKKAAQVARAGCNVILDWGFWTEADRKAAAVYFGERNIPVQWHYMDIKEDRWRENIARRNARILRGEGGSDFYVDEGLLQKVNGLFETPAREDMDVWNVLE